MNWIKRRSMVLVLALIALTGSGHRSLVQPVSRATAVPNGQPHTQAPSRRRLSEFYGKTALSFEANQGQTDQQVRFLTRGINYTLFLTRDSAVLALHNGDSVSERHLARGSSESPHPHIRASDSKPFAADERPRAMDAVFSMKLAGANANASVMGLDELPGKSNYFLGGDPRKWRSNVPTYAKVKYANVYPGVDLVYYGNQRQLEYDFVIQAGADPGVIRLGFSDAVRVDKSGDLVVGGEVVFHKPVVYQPANNQGQVAKELREGKYVVRNNRQVTFQVARYDKTRPLVIDPTLVYSTYLGGSDHEAGADIVVDASGNTYITGYTMSINFPVTHGVVQPKLGGMGGPTSNAFVSKLNATGSALLYSTYLGGINFSRGRAITVDASGNAYVTGWTASDNFPTTAGALQTTSGGGYDDAFVSKLNATGSELLYSTYLGGSSYDEGRGIAIDAFGNAYITGLTYSSNFPTTAGSFQTTCELEDAFVAKLNAAGSGLLYSTYLGGDSYDESHGIVIDASGNAYVTGVTYSSDFPTTPGAFQTAIGGGFDAFVSKLNAAGSALVYSTYLGGSSDDAGFGIAVNGPGDAFVTGHTYSSDFPTTPGALQTQSGGGGGYDDAFVGKLNSTGSALIYSTYLGGSGDDVGFGIKVDAAGNAYITGGTFSTNFPTTTGAVQRTFGGFNDAFAGELNSAGSALGYSTYLGGNNVNQGFGVAVDAAGDMYVTGDTFSSNFPTTPGAFQVTPPAGHNVFVTKIQIK
jgi:hypothetical protein